MVTQIRLTIIRIPINVRSMYVCICKRVRDQEIIDAVLDGDRNLRDVSRRLGVARQCGKCASYACEVIQQANAATAQNDHQTVA